MLVTTLRLVLGAADKESGMSGADAAEAKNRFIRFLISGGVNTLFGFAVYSIFILSGATVWLALISGTVIGALFNFFTTSGFVFRDLSFTRAPRFLLCYALVYVINLQALEWLSSSLSNKIVSQAILVLPIAVLSYLLMKKFVFVRPK
jgi:putative flippase GtrA